MTPLHRLSDADARVLDRLVDEAFDPAVLDRLPPEDRRRGEALLRLLSRLEELPAPVPDESIVARVMQGVDAAARERQQRLRVGAVQGLARRLRIPDLVTIAASVLLLIGVGWPIVNSVRGASLREQCGRNLVATHSGLARYGADNEGMLPLAAGFLSPGVTAARADRGAEGRAGPDWRSYQHGRSLDLLVDREYLPSRCLICPGCEHDRGAMALRVPAAGQRFHSASVRGMLVADANPAIDLLRRGVDWRDAATSGSFNHRQAGQNILLDDGSVRWLLSPILGNGDCIWTPGPIRDDAFAPGTLPIDPEDVFLAQ